VATSRRRNLLSPALSSRRQGAAISSGRRVDRTKHFTGRRSRPRSRRAELPPASPPAIARSTIVDGIGDVWPPTERIGEVRDARRISEGPRRFVAAEKTASSSARTHFASSVRCRAEQDAATPWPVRGVAISVRISGGAGWPSGDCRTLAVVLDDRSHSQSVLDNSGSANVALRTRALRRQVGTTWRVHRAGDVIVRNVALLGRPRRRARDGIDVFDLSPASSVRRIGMPP